MTPADLADLLRSTAAAVLADHGLDTAALPETVTAVSYTHLTLPTIYSV